MEILPLEPPAERRHTGIRRHLAAQARKESRCADSR